METKHAPGPEVTFEEYKKNCSFKCGEGSTERNQVCGCWNDWHQMRFESVPDLLAKVSEQQREIERLKSEHKSLRLSVQRFHQTLIARNYNNIGVWHNERQQYNFELITEVETILISKK